MSNPKNWLSEDIECEIEEAWEETDEPASSIAARYGVTKNSIIGLARRKRWQRGRGRPTTMMERLQVMLDKFDREIAELKRLGT